MLIHVNVWTYIQLLWNLFCCCHAIQPSPLCTRQEGNRSFDARVSIPRRITSSASPLVLHTLIPLSRSVHIKATAFAHRAFVLLAQRRTSVHVLDFNRSLTAVHHLSSYIPLRGLEVLRQPRAATCPSSSPPSLYVCSLQDVAFGSFNCSMLNNWVTTSGPASYSILIRQSAQRAQENEHALSISDHLGGQAQMLESAITSVWRRADARTLFVGFQVGSQSTLEAVMSAP